jgi:hypothetical protein
LSDYGKFILVEFKVTKKKYKLLMPKVTDMRTASENYKGIEYVRISSLPPDQKNHIYKSLNHKLIINILKDNALLNDCLQYQNYIIWYENIYKTMVQEKAKELRTTVPVLTLAFK